MYTLYSTILATIIFMVYNIICIKFFSVPKSLSATHYLWKNKNEKLKFVFPVFIVIIVALLLPSWIQISEGSNFQFTAFLSAASLLFVGAAPNFKNVGLEDKVHTVAAILSAIFAISWILLVPFPIYYGASIVLGVTVLIGILAFIYTTDLTPILTYIGEIIAFISTFAAIIIYNIYKYV